MLYYKYILYAKKKKQKVNKRQSLIIDMVHIEHNKSKSTLTRGYATVD